MFYFDDHVNFCQFRFMTNARSVGLGILGLLLGGAVGGGVGLLGGLAYTSLASTSGFEGYSGFVVVYWILTGIVLGLIAGSILAVKLASKA